MKKIRALSAGETIGIVATGSPVEPGRFQTSLEYIHSLGFQTKIPLDPARDYGSYKFGFSNGSAAERAEALRDLVLDPEVAVILTARGGYGSMDLLPLLDAEEIIANPKPLVGMSDVTALLFQWSEKFGVPAIHGPGAATSFADAADDEAAAKSVRSLIDLLSKKDFDFSSKLSVLRKGEGFGRILAGNLTMAVSLLGTPWDVDYQDAVLVLEEVGDSPYIVHRNLTQLKLSGKLDSLAALVFGRFSKCQSAHGPLIEDVLEMSADVILQGTSFPILSGLEFGHWGENVALPLGSEAKIDGGVFRLEGSPLE